MVGWSRWWRRLSSLILCATAAASCSQLPIPPYDDGGVRSDGTQQPTFGPRPLTPILVDAVALAADDSGIYWTSPANGLWVLPAGIPIPIPLARNRGAAAVSCPGGSRLALSSSYAFWLSSDRAVLNRTSKDASADDEVAALAGGDSLAIDGSAVYWTERAPQPDGYVDGSAIRMLPQDASAGSPPMTLLLSLHAITSLTVVNGAAYWTPAANATVYHADLWTATVEALASGAPGTNLLIADSPNLLIPAGGQIYFEFFAGLWSTGLGRLAADDSEQSIAILPESEYGAGLAVADGWLLATTYSSVGCGGTPSLNLYATPLAGGAPKLIAQGLRTPAIAAPQGIVFVDADRHLVALPTDELATTVSPVP